MMEAAETALTAADLTRINHDAAQSVASHGLFVVPCRPNKSPLITGAYKNASNDPAQIEQWWKQWPTAIPGVSCELSGLVVFDCDLKPAIKAVEAVDGKPAVKARAAVDGIAAFLAILREDEIDFCQFPAVRTQSGGIHMYCKAPAGFEPSNATGSLPAGIDVRSAGHVIAPGAVMPNGRRYLVTDGTPNLPLAFMAGTIPELPGKLRARLGPGKPPGVPATVPGPPAPPTVQPPPGPATARELAYAKAALDRTCADLAGRLPGSGRNLALNNAALPMGEMIAAGWIERSTVEAALFGAAVQNGYVAKDGERQAHDTMQSGIKDGMRQPRAPLLDDAIPPNVASYVAGLPMLGAPATPALDGEQATDERTIQPTTNPYTPPPGLMGEIAKYIYDSAPRQVPEIALAGAIGWMAGFAGRAYNINGVGLNLYIAMLASSGSGKEAISNGYAALLDSILPKVPSAAHFIGPADFASPQAVLKFVASAEHCAISVIGEFGNWLNQMTGERQNPIRGAIKSVLMEMYGKSGKRGVYRQTVYSDKENNINEIRAPAFSLVGESTPSTFYRNISDASIEDGFLPRFILVEYEGENKYLNPNAQHAVVPASLTEKLVMFATICLDLNAPAIGGTSLLPRGPMDVMCDFAAQSRLDQLSRVYTDNANAANTEGLKNLWSRVWLNIAKLAALVAVGCNMGNPIISLEHVTWAENLVTYSVNKIIAKIDSGEVAGSDEAKQWQALVKLLREVSSYDAAKASAYTMNPQMVKARVINTKWLNQRVSKLAIFQHDRYGPTAAVKRVLERALAEELLLRHDFPQRVSGGGCTYQIR